MEEIHSLTTTDPAVISSKMTATAAPAPAIASVDSGPVLAYAKLEGQEYCYYIRTLQVTLGRQVAKPGTVDIPLGNARSVSRHHARLFYNFATQRFELMVFGKNGAFVNERFVEKGVTVPLENRTKIKIGDSTFLFLLPRIKSIDHQHQHRPPMRTTPEPIAAHHEKDAEVDDDNTSNKDTKPPFSYATLIAQAINSNQDKRMALHEIYNYITNHYPYYQMAQNGWQNSIRHNLSLNKAFVKVPRSDTEPGKGAFWTIDPKADMEFLLGTANSNNINGSINNPNKRSNSTITSGGDSSGEASEKPTGDTTAVVVTSPVSTSSNKVSERKRAKKEHKSSSLPSLSDPASAATVAEALPSIAVPEEPATALLPSSATSPSSQPTSSQKQIPPAAAVTSQAQIQLQLQATIRQHLLDPVRNPLPPSIAQLLPQAIAQLPPHLAMQFSSTLQSALRAHQQTNQDPPAAGAPGLVATPDAVSSNTTATATTTTTTITTTAAAAAADSVTVPASDTAPSAPSSPPSPKQSLSNP